MRNKIISVCNKTTSHFKSLLSSTNHKHIFIGVKGGGCNGLKYEIEPSSDELQAFDEKIIINNVPIVVCGKSLMFIIGIDIKWKTNNMGSGLEFINPNATSSCGCGDTFSA